MKFILAFISIFFLFISCQKDEKYQIPYPEEGRFDCQAFTVNDTQERGFFTCQIDGEPFMGTSVIGENQLGEWIFFGIISDDNCVRRAVLRINFSELFVPLKMDDFPFDHRQCTSGIDSTARTASYDSRDFDFLLTTSDQINALYSCKTNEYEANFEMIQYHGDNEVIEGTFSAKLYRDTASVCMRNPRYADEIKIEGGYFQATVRPFVN